MNATALVLLFISVIMLLASWGLSPHTPEPQGRDDAWHRADGVGAGMFTAAIIVGVAAILATVVPPLVHA